MLLCDAIDRKRTDGTYTSILILLVIGSFFLLLLLLFYSLAILFCMCEPRRMSLLRGKQPTFSGGHCVIAVGMEIMPYKCSVLKVLFVFLFLSHLIYECSSTEKDGI